MRICMITREFPPDLGGIGHYVYNLSKKLVERGHEVTVITRGSAGKSVRKVVDGIDIYYAPFFPVYPFHVWLHGIFVEEILKSFKPEPTLVHLHSPITPPIKTSLPVITTIHTPMKIDTRYHEIFDLYSLAEHVQSMVVYPAIESKLLGLSNLITTVALSVSRELEEYGFDPKKTIVVGNGVDEKTFAPLQNDNHASYVLYTGVLRARKGLFDLIECAKYVCEAHPETRFVICGTGPFFPKIVEKVRRMGLQKQVIFSGYISKENLVQVYQNAAVQVVPSHYEGLPTVLLEGMSCGIPVVATAVGGSSEVISQGVNGFLVPPKSPVKLANAVSKLLDDAPLRDRVGHAARKTIEEHYTWDKVADKIVECYESVL